VRTPSKEAIISGAGALSLVVLAATLDRVPVEDRGAPAPVGALSLEVRQAAPAENDLVQEQEQASAPADLQSIPLLSLVIELARRGITEWGCPRDVTASWDAPDSGMRAIAYDYEYTVAGRVVDGRLVKIPLPDGGKTVRFVVAGVDSLGRDGQRSEPAYWP
jgi:hypothetical protein